MALCFNADNQMTIRSLEHEPVSSRTRKGDKNMQRCWTLSMLVLQAQPAARKLGGVLDQDHDLKG